MHFSIEEIIDGYVETAISNYFFTKYQRCSFFIENDINVNFSIKGVINDELFLLKNFIVNFL